MTAVLTNSLKSLLSAKDMICQTGSDILTSCPTYDESACSIYNEKNQVSENKNRPDGRSGRQAADRLVGRSVGRAKSVHFFVQACRQRLVFMGAPSGVVVLQECRHQSLGSGKTAREQGLDSSRTRLPRMAIV